MVKSFLGFKWLGLFKTMFMKIIAKFEQCVSTQCEQHRYGSV